MDDFPGFGRWSEDVIRAQLSGDGDALSALYAYAVTQVGKDRASRLWWKLMSGFDASAVTG